MRKISGGKGFTFVEVVVAGLILTLIVAALIQYHASSGAGSNQEYYLKAVQVARGELEKLRVLYELDSGVSEFADTGPPPPSVFLFKYAGEQEQLDLPAPINQVYYDHHGYYNNLFRRLGPLKPTDPPDPTLGAYSGVSKYHEGYEQQFAIFADTDNVDKRSFTYFTYDTGSTYPPHSDYLHGKVDASVAVIDDMGSADDPTDDLLGNLGWWIEDVAVSGTTCLKKVTFALQFSYPGENAGQNPEVIVLRTTLVVP